MYCRAISPAYALITVVDVLSYSPGVGAIWLEIEV